MSRNSTGPSYYQILPDGRFSITPQQLRALESGDQGRILDTTLSGRSARVLLLDRPLQLGSPVDSQDGTFYLDRIRLRDLSGWPPRLAAPRGDLGPPLLDCRLIAARFKRANASGQEGLEFDLVYQGTVYSAWLLGCPLPLLIGALKTLNAPGVFGNRLVDVQEMRLIGEGKGS